MFQFPNVTDILFPTSWVDELPYFLAPEVQLAFAAANEVNFLASGRHAPERMGKGGKCSWIPLIFTKSSFLQLLEVVYIPQLVLSTTHMTLEVVLSWSWQKYQ